jgi:hypothetical protein
VGAYALSGAEPGLSRRAKAATAAAAPVAAAIARPRAFVVTHTRQALQHVVASGAASAYFPAACPMRPVAISFTGPVYDVSSPDPLDDEDSR